MVRRFLIECKPRKPAPGEMHAMLFNQLAFTRYTI